MTPPTEPPEQLLTPNERSLLRQYLTGRFSLAQLKNLAYDVGIDYERLTHHQKEDFPRELLLRCQHAKTLGPLIQNALNLRPDKEISWLLWKLEGAKWVGEYLDALEKRFEVYEDPARLIALLTFALDHSRNTKSR